MENKCKRKDEVSLSAKAFLGAVAVDTSISLCVYDIGVDIAAVKAKLERLYGGVAVVADGRRCALNDVSRADVIELDAQPDFDKKSYNVIDAARVIDRLMQKPGGCPWDSVQTHESIRINMIEEAYEAVDAIDNNDRENMIEEFGDVLLQSLLQSAIARRDGEFDFLDVCDGLCKKLISRHTFIFGGDSAGNADDAITLWEKNKAVEKHYDTLKDQLQKLPEAFPALLYSQKVHKKTSKAGMDTNPQKQFDEAISERDLVKQIDACVALLALDGRDAEVELNKYVKAKIAKL